MHQPVWFLYKSTYCKRWAATFLAYKIKHMKGSREEPEMSHLQKQIVDIAGSSKVRSGHLRFFHGIAFHQRNISRMETMGCKQAPHAVNSGTEIL